MEHALCQRTGLQLLGSVAAALLLSIPMHAPRWPEMLATAILASWAVTILVISVAVALVVLWIGGPASGGYSKQPGAALRQLRWVMTALPTATVCLYLLQLWCSDAMCAYCSVGPPHKAITVVWCHLVLSYHWQPMCWNSLDAFQGLLCTTCYTTLRHPASPHIVVHYITLHHIPHPGHRYLSLRRCTVTHRPRRGGHGALLALLTTMPDLRFLDLMWLNIDYSDVTRVVKLPQLHYISVGKQQLGRKWRQVVDGCSAVLFEASVGMDEVLEKELLKQGD